MKPWESQLQFEEYLGNAYVHDEIQLSSGLKFPYAHNGTHGFLLVNQSLQEEQYKNLIVENKAISEQANIDPCTPVFLAEGANYFRQPTKNFSLSELASQPLDFLAVLEMEEMQVLALTEVEVYEANDGHPQEDMRAIAYFQPPTDMKKPRLFWQQLEPVNHTLFHSEFGDKVYTLGNQLNI